MLAIIRRVPPSRQMGNCGSSLPTASASSIHVTLPSTSFRHRCISSKITADGKKYEVSSLEMVGLRLPPLVRDLEIDYTALSLVAPEKVRFRYKLEGHDRDWRTWAIAGRRSTNESSSAQLPLPRDGLQ